jgi:hypothetical protein
VLDTKKPSRYITWYQAPDGERSCWESSVGAVERDGKVVGFAVITTNVAEQRRDAEERERFFNLSMDMLCVADLLLKADGSIGTETMEDFLHPTERAYRSMTDAVAPTIERLLDARTQR